MNAKEKPTIAITMGDPCGIGPEVVTKALATNLVFSICTPIVVGDTATMLDAINLTRLPLKINTITDPAQAQGISHCIDVLDIQNLPPESVTVGKVSPRCGRAAMEWVTKAGELALAGEVQGLATAPLNKEAASLAGYKAIGHMELLQELSGAQEVATMLMSGRLRVVHLTTHRSLRLACDYVKKEHILSKLELTHTTFEQWGMPNPNIGVPAINPHGSDGGLLGNEEADEISPAIQEARERGIRAHGPVPADIVFHKAIKGDYDVVLAMYHDQGHIPVKVYGFEKSISANLGLPFVRTSVDHGTAFDIAGLGIAQPQSMIEAITVAVALCTGKGL